MNETTIIFRPKQTKVLRKPPISGFCPDPIGIIEHGDLGGNENKADFDEK